MIRPLNGQTNALDHGFRPLSRLRDGAQGAPLRAGGGADPQADQQRRAEARRPASARAGAGREARGGAQLHPRRRPHPGGDGHPRAAAGPRHGGAGSLRGRAGGAALAGAHPQARVGDRAARRAPDDRAGPGRARGEERHRGGDRQDGRDPRTPRGQAAPGRAGHRRGLGLPLRDGAGIAEQRGAPRARRLDGPLAREPLALPASSRAAEALVRGASPHPPRHPAARRQGRGGRGAAAPGRDRRSSDATDLSRRKKRMGRLFAVEIVYRGIFQKKLAANLSRAIVLAAHREGKPGISFGRYGDSPERNGIPAKYFAIVATDELTLEEGKAKYEPKEVDVSICVDDTLFKGVESWAWYGLQPINKLLKPNGTLIVT